MGTSLEMIDRTYGHLTPDADEYELSLLDAFGAWFSTDHGDILGHRRLTSGHPPATKLPKLAYVQALVGCARQDSNLRPLPPQGSALSPELRARDRSV